MVYISSGNNYNLQFSILFPIKDVSNDDIYIYFFSDGKIHNSVPWGFKKITNFFSAIIYMIIML